MTDGQLTWLIWIAAAGCGTYAFAKVRANPPTLLNRLLRVSFSGCVMLFVWTATVYVLWLAGIPLTVGAIDNGQIGRHWWLPSVIILWAVLTYRGLHHGEDHE